MTMIIENKYFVLYARNLDFFSQILPLKVLYFDLKQSSDLYKGKTIECCMQLDMQHRNKGNHNQGKIQVSLYNIDNGEAKKK